MTLAPADTEMRRVLDSDYSGALDTFDPGTKVTDSDVRDALRDTFNPNGTLIGYPFARLAEVEPVGKGSQNFVFKLNFGDITPKGIDEQFRRLYLAQWLEDHGYTNVNFLESKEAAEYNATRTGIDGKIRFMEDFYKRKGGKNPFTSKEAVALVSRDRLSPDNEMGKWLERSADVLIGYYHPAMVHSAWTSRINDRLVTVSEYVPGISPKKFREAANLKGMIDVIHQVAVALNDFEKHNLVHRDIKPDNIMIEAVAGSNGRTKYRAKLADFGLAKVQRGRDHQGGFTLTCTGQAMGTPAYMSPEVVENGVDVDFRTDIFSLGATLYNFMTGRIFNPPLPRPDAQPGVIKNADVLFNALHWDVRPPRMTDMPMTKFFGDTGSKRYRLIHRRRAKMQDMIIGRIEDIICASCQYEPNHRYSQWQQLRLDLRHFADPNYHPRSDILKSQAKKRNGKHMFYGPLTSQR